MKTNTTRKTARKTAKKGRVIYVAVRVKENDSWDPSYRTEDPEAIAACASPGAAYQAIVEDAKKVLKSLGFSEAKDPEWWEDMLDTAGSSDDWMEPREGEGRWKWNVSQVRYAGGAR